MKATCIALFSFFLFAFTCEGDKKENQQLNNFETEVIEAIATTGLKAEDFKSKLDELLTLEMAVQVSGLPASEAKKEHSKFSSLESLAYEWNSNRTKKVEFMKGKFIEAPIKNAIELTWVKNTTLKEFKHDYHNPTPEELKNAQAAMDQKMKEMQAEGKATKEQSVTASGVALGSISKFKVEEVPNLGDYSVFVNSGIMGASTRDLKVFYKGLSFTIRADLSENESDNDKKAIRTAQMIIDQKLE